MGSSNPTMIMEEKKNAVGSCTIATASTPPSFISTRSMPLPSSETRTGADDHRIAALKLQVGNLECQLEEILAKQDEVNSKLKHPDNPETTVKRHIRLLHEFNEVRDIAQGLIGLIAESRGVRVQDIYPEFGLDPDD